MNILHLNQEQIEQLPDSQKLEIIQHYEKWFLLPEEVQARKYLVEKTIDILRITSPKIQSSFIQNCKSNTAIIDIAVNLRPVKDRWLTDFIRGLKNMCYDNPEQAKRADKLMLPVHLVRALFMSTKIYQEYFFDRSIPETDVIETIFNANLKETVNTRETIKKIVDHKKIKLFHLKQIKKLKLEYLLEQNELVEEFNKQQPDQKNPFPRIFSSGTTYALFMHWREHLPSTSKPLAEYSFIYRSMIADGFILPGVRPTEFREFLDQNYEITLSEIKTLDKCSGGKQTRYATALDLFQLKSMRLRKTS